MLWKNYSYRHRQPTRMEQEAENKAIEEQRTILFMLGADKYK